jgi:ATP-dependent Lhr-like helicase
VALEDFHPLVRDWFCGRFGTPTEAQAQGWPAIRAGEDTLIAAPTGSGKTLAAFLTCIDALVAQSQVGALPDATQVVYVSPLKALSNDIQKNLEAPLAELRERAAAQGLAPLDIRVGVRTGDTPQSARQAMLKRPPHLVVTTPETLYLLLTSEGGRRMLRTVRTVIVDEIHAVADDKRGAHLSLSLERLDALCERRPVRIGLSATQNPIDEVARFLVGAARVSAEGIPACRIVDVGRGRALDLAIEVPRDELAAVASHEQWSETLDRIAEIVKEHRSTLVFVNTRRLVERVTHALASRLGEPAVAAHHGSLSRAVRLRSEARLKSGEAKAVVATASLELGIDIGHVDLVVQIGTPRSFAVAVQRAGRAGHYRGATPKARFFPMSRDELIECAATLRGIHRGLLERIEVVPHPLDVLAQQIVAVAACEEIGEDDLFRLVVRSWSYRGLAREDFDAVVAMLSDGIATRKGRRAALLHRDGVHRKVKGRRGARIAALTGAGAIPDTAQYKVVAEPEGTHVGTLDEDFAVESMAGDIILLGNTSWRIRRVETGTVRVEDAHGSPPTIPFWLGEAPGRSFELSAQVGALREDIDRRAAKSRDGAVAWLVSETSMPAAGARQAVDYILVSKAILGAIPSQDTLVAERFFDDSGGMQLVVHAPFGGRLNRGLGLALRKRFCRTFDFELQAAATDEGVLLSLGPQHSFPLDSIFDLFGEDDVEELLTQAALQSPMFGVRWRWALTRALAIPRMQGGKKLPPALARMRSDDLLAAVFPAATACQDNDDIALPREIPDHPLVKEALRDCLYEAMDANGLRALMNRVATRTVRIVARDVIEPSPLSHEILNSKPYTFLDDAPLEERRARAVSLRRTLSPEDAAAFGCLDTQAIATVVDQLWPDVRSPDDMHDALLDLSVLPISSAESWRDFGDALVASRRVVRAALPCGPAWVAAERAELVRTAYGAVAFDPDPMPVRHDLAARADDEFAAAERVVGGWAACQGPFVADALAARLGMPQTLVDAALTRLESHGVVIRGRFTSDVAETEWCDRAALARIHRLTMATLRREIEPVTTADFLRYLLRWQHVHPGTQLQGSPGLAEIIAQLEGFHVAAGCWEDDVLPSRVVGYRSEWLDHLCMSGEVAWGRLAFERAPDEPQRRRAAPTRSAPVALMRRAQLPALLAALATPPPPLGPSAQAVVELLATRGALFTREIAAQLRRVESEAEGTLWELVSAGRVTCDGFAGLRALIAPERRHERMRPSRMGGRWSLLRPVGEPVDAPPEAVADDPACVQLASLYLKRYGVVFRDLLAREPNGPPWRELLRVYRRMESRGEIRGGRFVVGTSGEQFARAEALDALRTVRRAPQEGREIVEISATDPLNLAGILTPGPRIPAVRGLRVRFTDGVPEAVERRARVAGIRSL